MKNYDTSRSKLIKSTSSIISSIGGIAANIACGKDQAAQDVNHHEVRKELMDYPLANRKTSVEYSKLFSFKEL